MEYEYTREQVRDFISFTYKRISMQIIFEFNTKSLRSKYKHEMEQLLEFLSKMSPVKDFKVVCDETNNGNEIINANMFVCETFVLFEDDDQYLNYSLHITSTGVALEEIQAA